MDNQFDIARTSPPYATALPYIDTSRLSLVWLKLTPPSKIKDLEYRLLGSREIGRYDSLELIKNIEKFYWCPAQ